MKTDEEKTKERLDRVEALNGALRHKTTNEQPNDVVKAAEKYLKFLQGK